MAAASATPRRSLVDLAEALDQLTAALETGREDAVLAMEPRLAAAIEAVRLSTPIAASPGAIEPIADLAAAVRDHVARCRRLGGTVPALLSVMFPGRGLYGRDGRRRDAAGPSTAAPVI